MRWDPVLLGPHDPIVETGERTSRNPSDDYLRMICVEVVCPEPVTVKEIRSLQSMGFTQLPKIVPTVADPLAGKGPLKHPHPKRAEEYVIWADVPCFEAQDTISEDGGVSGVPQGNVAALKDVMTSCVAGGACASTPKVWQTPGAWAGISSHTHATTSNCPTVS